VGGASITGNGTVTLSGTGTVTLTGANSYFGLTTLGSGATLVVGNATALQNSTVDVTNGTLNFAPGTTAATLGGLEGSNSAPGLVLANAGGAAVTLTVGGNNGTTTFSGNISGPGGIAMVGTGALTLLNVNYTGTTAVNAGTMTITGNIGSSGNLAGAITANGGTLNVNGAALYAPSLTQNSNGGNVFLTGNGTISLSGALGVNADNQDFDGVVSLASGTVTAASAAIGRDGDNLGATAPTAGSTADGLYVDGATVTIATTLGVGYFNGAENSSGQMRVDAGSVTVGGITTVSNDAGSRFSLLDLNGGTFTDNDTSGTGIQVGGAADASLDAELLVRGTATVNTPAITLGNTSDTGGLLEFMDIGGTTYIGSGGIVSTVPSNTTVTVALGSASVTTAPVLAASGNWSSSRPMTLSNSSAGVAVIFQTANASGSPENFTLSGILSGTGGLTETGGGTLTLSGANTYTGATTITQGTLMLAGSLAGSAVTVQSGATLSGTGVMAGALTVQSGGGLGLNASGNLSITGSVTWSGNVTVTAAANVTVGNYTLLGYGGSLSGAPVFSYVPPSGASQAATFSTATAHVITVTVYGPPPAPTGFTATSGDGNISLAWSGAAGATGYTVKRSTTNGSGYTSVDTNVSGTTFLDTTAVNGTQYYYIVIATNAAGASSNSTQVSATPLQSFSDWASTAFGGSTNPNLVGPTATPDGDGVPNLLKYFFGLNPATNAGAQQVASSVDNPGDLVLTFPMAKNLGDVTYQIQSSTDLVTWTNTGVTASIASDQGTYYLMQAVVPTAGNPAFYLRVAVFRQ